MNISRHSLHRTRTCNSKASGSSAAIGTKIKLQIQDVRDNHSFEKQILFVKQWSTIIDIKEFLCGVTSVPTEMQRLFYGPIGRKAKGNVTSSFSTFELQDHQTLLDIEIESSGATLLFNVKPNYTNGNGSGLSHTMLKSVSICPSDACVASSVWDLTPPFMRWLVLQARQGLVQGLKPELGIDGSGGTYFLRNKDKRKVCVFKPSDEEPYALNNPRGYLNTGTDHLFMRDGVIPGEACIREVAAYLLDHDGYSSVPMTTLAQARHPNFNVNGSHLSVAEGGAAIGMHSILSSPLMSASMHKSFSVKRKVDNDKIGSCQEFIYAECTMDDISPSKINVDEIHKIVVLDIRLMNADRNTANLLCRRKEDNSLELVPIDHGFCLRTSCDVAWFDWCWLEWPQVKEPISLQTREYILSLDVEKDTELLRERFHIDNEALNIFRASSHLLQTGVQAGLTLYDIALLCSRHDDAGEEKSRLEILMSMAEEISFAAVQNGRWDHVVASKALAHQLFPSSIPAMPKMKSNGMVKSTSMFVMDSLDFGEKKDEDDYYGENNLSVPPAAHESLDSDSSEDFDFDKRKDEGDECEFWAAGIIADVQTAVKSQKIRRSRQRSISISSSVSSDGSSICTNLSSSPKGFWTKRPDSADEDSTKHHIAWSPSTSPASSFLLNHMNAMKKTKPIGSRPTNCSPMMKNASKEEPFKVTSDVNGLKPSSVGIKRSQSYSIISSFGSLSHSNCESFSNKFVEKSKHVKDSKYDEYFSKFIYLLVERETARAERKKFISD